MEIVEFLRAQLDEDERVARAAPSDLDNGAWPFHIGWVGVPEEHDYEAAKVYRDQFRPKRALAEVDAKRQILAEHHPVDPCDAHGPDMRSEPCPTLRLLALPYADHPDYDASWRT